MRRKKAEELANWLDDMRRDGFEHRNWRVVWGLTAASVALLLTAGLLVHLRSETPELVVLCIGAGMFAGAMLTYFYNDRLFVERPPTR